MADLSVNIGKLNLSNPVMTASGTFGYGLEFQDFVNLEKIGGIIVKGTTLHHREGNPYPRMAETPMGMLNAVGLQNKGVHYFVDHIYPQIKDIRTPGHRAEHILPEREAGRYGFRCNGSRSCRSGECRT